MLFLMWQLGLVDALWAQERERKESPLSFRIGAADFTPGGFVDFEKLFRTSSTGSCGQYSRFFKDMVYNGRELCVRKDGRNTFIAQPLPTSSVSGNLFQPFIAQPAKLYGVQDFYLNDMAPPDAKWSTLSGTSIRYVPFGTLAGQVGINSAFAPAIGGVGNPLLFNDSFLSGGAWATGGVDMRLPTWLGEVRFYGRVSAQGLLGDQGGGQGTVALPRAFIQWAGFTFGRVRSLRDAPALGNSAFSYYQSPTDFSGTWGLGYSANLGQFGLPNITASIALEDPTVRQGVVWDAGTNVTSPGLNPGPTRGNDAFFGTCFPRATTAVLGSNTPCEYGDGEYGALQVPDVVGSLRVDQAWGSAQIASALHQLRAGYYGNNFDTSFVGSGGFTGVTPSDKWGWAVVAGAVMNLPWSPGDQFWLNGAYTQGAVSYLNLPYNNFLRFGGTGALASGFAFDGIFANQIGPATVTTPGVAAGASGLQLTEAWSITAAIEHYWTPALRTSVYGGRSSINYNSSAIDIFCSSPFGPVRTAAGVAPNFATGPVRGCDPSFALWQVGTRTIWNPVKNLDIGVEIVYSQLHQNMDPNLVRMDFTGVPGGRPGGLYVPSDEGVWSGMVRVQRNFYP